MSITKVAATDIPELENLVNHAYRGEESKKGWTSEAYLLRGIRINKETLSAYLQQENVTILKYTDIDNKIIGTVYLEVKGNALYLGMLSVSPVVQSKGTGRALLQEAEVFAKAHNCDKISMTVISVRSELISWYERRGYVFTGEMQPFHGDGKFGESDQKLEFIVMEKIL